MTSEYFNESSEELEQRLNEKLDATASNVMMVKHISKELEDMIIEDIVRLDTAIAEDKAKFQFGLFVLSVITLGAVIVSTIIGAL